MFGHGYGKRAVSDTLHKLSIPLSARGSSHKVSLNSVVLKIAPQQLKSHANLRKRACMILMKVGTVR